MNKIIKQRAHFSHFLPLPCHFEHGWIPSKEALKSDLMTKKPLMLVRSKRRLKAWQKQSKIPAAIVGSPFIHYKNMHHIKRRADASGTVVFPSHSTHDIQVDYDIEALCAELKALPKRFQPVTICLFWLDYKRERAKYRRCGFKVVTTGSKLGNSYAFVKNFYKILSAHKYSTSNQVGTYSFLSIDFGTPFFLVSKAPTLLNKTGKDLNIKQTAQINDFMYGRRATKIFSTGPVNKITKEQKEFVALEMGVNDCLSPDELREVLWKPYRINYYWFLVILPYLVWSVAVKTGFLTTLKLFVRAFLKK